MTGHHHDHAEHTGHGGHERGPLADASVRLAASSDAPAVGLVQAAVWTERYGGLVPATVAATFRPESFARAWRASLESPPTPKHRLLVACAGEQVVGVAAVGPSPDPDATSDDQAAQVTDDAELLLLAVHPQARGAGHGSRLLNAVADTTREAGFTRLRAWLSTGMPDVEGFLSVAGFVPDGAARDRLLAPEQMLRERRFAVRL